MVKNFQNDGKEFKLFEQVTNVGYSVVKLGLVLEHDDFFPNNVEESILKLKKMVYLNQVRQNFAGIQEKEQKLPDFEVLLEVKFTYFFGFLNLLENFYEKVPDFRDFLVNE